VSGGEGLVVGGVEFFVGAGARDAHARAALGVEEEGGAVAVEEFAGGAVDRGMVGRDEREAEFVLAGEDGGDLGVGADGISFAGEIGAEGGEDVADDAEIGAEGGGRSVERVGEGGALGGGRGGDFRIGNWGFRFRGGR